MPSRDVETEVRIIAGILTEDALCLECLADIVELPASAVGALVERIVRTLVIAREQGECGSCERKTTVYGIRGTPRFPFDRADPTEHDG